jgi:hypothetical protein
VDHLRDGEIPDRFDGWFTPECPAAASDCPFSESAHSSLWVFARTKLISYSNGRITVQLVAPCLKATDILEEYSIRALPYEENGRAKRIKLLQEDLRIWIKKHDNSNWTLVEQPMQCTSSAKSKVDICPPQTTQTSRLPVLNAQNMIEEEYTEDDDRPAVEVVDLSDNQVLIAAPRQENAVYKCPHINAEEHPVRGISRLKIPPGCSLDLALGKISLRGQIHDDLQGSQYLKKRIYDKEWLPLTNDLLFGKKSTSDHTQQHHGYQRVANYVGGAMIAVALLALLCVLTIQCREFYKDRSRKHRRRRQNFRSPTRLVVRNVPDI